MGLLITRMSEKLWLNSNLNLGIAVTQARQSEEVKKCTNNKQLMTMIQILGVKIQKNGMAEWN